MPNVAGWFCAFSSVVLVPGRGICPTSNRRRRKKDVSAPCCRQLYTVESSSPHARRPTQKNNRRHTDGAGYSRSTRICVPGTYSYTCVVGSHVKRDGIALTAPSNHHREHTSGLRSGSLADDQVTGERRSWTSQSAKTESCSPAECDRDSQATHSYGQPAECHSSRRDGRQQRKSPTPRR